MKTTEAYFIDHCDYELCDLGSFDYECPECGKHISDYDIWWKNDDIYLGEIVKFQCENCNEKLVVYWNKENYDYLVTKDVAKI